MTGARRASTSGTTASRSVAVARSAATVHSVSRAPAAASDAMTVGTGVGMSGGELASSSTGEIPSDKMTGRMASA
jgi:hypothetical protein